MEENKENKENKIREERAITAIKADVAILEKKLACARKRIKNATKAYNNSMENIKKQIARVVIAKQTVENVKIKIANQLDTLQRLKEVLSENGRAN